MAWLRSNWQGLLLCLLISVPAYYLGVLVPVVGGPVFAILIGMILALVIRRRENLQAGVNFTSKKILQWAVKAVFLLRCSFCSAGYKRCSSLLQIIKKSAQKTGVNCCLPHFYSRFS